MRTPSVAPAAVLVAGTALLACGGSESPSGPPHDPETGALRLSVQTLGDVLDPDGYTVLIDGVERGVVNATGSVVISDIGVGLRIVRLGGVADNCRLTDRTSSAQRIDEAQTLDLELVVFCLAADAGRIFFVEQGVVWSMSAVGGDRRPLIEGTRLAVSADGSMIAFTKGDQDIWIANSEGGEARNLTNTPGQSERDPAWSPDGKKIAFEARLPGAAQHDVFVMNADGSNWMNLTNNPDFGDGDPAWSPDGTRIVFRSHRPPTEGGDLYIMNADGTGLTEGLGVGPFPTIPQWSPDGSRIVYAGLTPAGVFAIFVIQPDGSGLVQLTQGASSEPTWSPDSRWIAFADVRNTGSFQIFVMRDDGSDVVQLTYGTVSDQPNWAPTP